MRLEDKYWAAGWFDSQKAKPCLEKRNPTRIAWVMEVSTFLNNDLLIFFRDNFGAIIKKVKGYGPHKGTLGDGYSLRLKFTKPALVRVIEELGPYLRQRREIYEEIAKEGKFIQLEGFPTNDPRCQQEVTMPSSLFDSKYQKNYAAGVLEGSCFTYFKGHINPQEEICTKRKGKKTDTINAYMTISIIAKKYLEHEKISHSFSNVATKNKFKVVKAECIKKLLDNLLDYVKFRKDFKVLRSAVEWWSNAEKKMSNGQLLDSAKEKCKYYTVKINENHFDESLVKNGIDGKQQSLHKKEKDEWVNKERLLEKESREFFETIQGKTKDIKKIKKRFLIKEYSEFWKKQEKELKRIEFNAWENISDKAKCRRCELIKSKKNFTINSTLPSGVGLYCKKCVSEKGKLRQQDPKVKEKNRQYYLDNKEDIRAYVKEYNKTYVSHKDDYDKYIDRTRIGSGEEFWNSSKDLEDLGITVYRGIGTHARKFKLSKNDFFMHLEEEWRLLPAEMKDCYGLPHELTVEEIFELRRKKLIEIDHIIPKARIKALVQQGHARGCEVHPHHGLNLRPLPKELNCRRSSTFSLLAYYPNYKKRLMKIHRAIFQKTNFKTL